jgi:predicted DNA-binding transcriptional regulator AlpA
LGNNKKTKTHQPREDSLLMNEKQAAEFLGLSLSYLRKSRMQAQLSGKREMPPYIKLKKLVYYRKPDLIAWLDRQTVTSVDTKNH